MNFKSFCFIFCLILLGGCQKNEPAIIISHNAGVNYVTHLYTLAGIGFSDEEYSAKYGSSLSQEDIDTLKRYRKEMSFANSTNGFFAQFLYFVPSYADICTKSGYQKYFEAINDMFVNRDPSPMDGYIPNNQKDSFMSMFQMDDIQWNNALSYLPAFNSISRVFIDNIEPYMKEIYPTVDKELVERENHLNQLLQGNNILAGWEKVTGLKWKYRDYTYLLFRAGKNGPSFNNLSENMNSFYYIMDDPYTVDMVSHEFGIFLMFDSIIPLWDSLNKKYPQYESDTTTGKVSWMAFESLSVFYNCIIKGDKTIDYYCFDNADAKTFFQIYDRLYKSGITTPSELYLLGIEEYMK